MGSSRCAGRAILVLDTMITFTALNERFRKDLYVFLKRTGKKLSAVFDKMEGGKLHPLIPQRFKARTNLLGQQYKQMA